MATKYQSIGRDFIFLIDQIENLEIRKETDTSNRPTKKITNKKVICGFFAVKQNLMRVRLSNKDEQT